jgi:hypothetical protein
MIDHLMKIIQIRDHFKRQGCMRADGRYLTTRTPS